MCGGVGACRRRRTPKPGIGVKESHPGLSRPARWTEVKLCKHVRGETEYQKACCGHSELVLFMLPLAASSHPEPPLAQQAKCRWHFTPRVRIASLEGVGGARFTCLRPL